jgi:hypothetical protein
VLAAPLITAQPQGALVCPGATVDLDVAASGTEPLIYRWYFNGTNQLSGQTGTRLTIAGVTTNDTGGYTVVVSDVTGSATSGVAQVSLPVRPSITTPPVARTVRQGFNTSFSVIAGGTAPFVYEWRVGGVVIPASNTNLLSLTNVQPSAAGAYEVVVANCSGSITSTPVNLTVLTPPNITVQPVSLSRSYGESASFSVTAVGTAITYQWRFNGTNIASANQSGYTIGFVTLANAGNYAVVCSSTGGSSTSQVAVLTVSSPPVVTTQPISQVITQGGSAIFAAVVLGSQPIDCQWFANGEEIPDATNLMFTLSNAQLNQAGTYQARFSNSLGVTSTLAAQLSVMPINQVLFFDFNTVAQLTNNFQIISNAGTLMQYYYETNTAGVGGGRGLDLPANGNDTTATLTNSAGFDFSAQGAVLGMSMVMKVKNMSASSAQRYLQIGFLDRFGASFNSTTNMGWMTMRVNATSQNNCRAKLQHQSKTVDNASAISGTETAEYYLVPGRWYKLTAVFENTKNLGSSYRVSGALIDYGTDGQTPGPVIFVIAPTLVTNADLVASTRLYPAFRANDTTGCDLLDNLAVYSGPIPVTLASSPASLTVLEGQSATLSFRPEGGASIPLLQWYSNAVAVPLGTNVVLTTSLLSQTANGARFWAVVSNAYGALTTGVATVRVSADPTPPVLLSAGCLDGYNVGLRFNKSLDPASASNPANYQVVGAPAVVTATLRSDGSNVMLHLTSPLATGAAFTVRANNLADFGGQALPANATATGVVMGWMPMDLNAPVVAGSSWSVASNEVDLIAGGSDLYGNADSGHLAAMPRSGDFDVSVRVAEIVRPNPFTVSPVTTYSGYEYTKGGLLFRETLNPFSRCVQQVALPSGTGYYPGAARSEFTARTVSSGTAASLGNGPVPSYPNGWLRLRRVNDTFTSYYSTNGLNWTLQASTTITSFPMAGYLALAGTAHYNVAGFSSLIRFRELRETIIPAGTLLLSTDLPANIDVNEGSTRQFSVAVFATGIAASEIQYLWQRAAEGGIFQNIRGANATNATYTTPALAGWLDQNSQYRCIITTPGTNLVTSVCTVNILDAVVPTLVSANNAVGQASGFSLVFSEAIPTNLLFNPANFLLSNTAGQIIPVTGVGLFGNARTAVLTTAVPLTNGTTYTVLVNNLTDVNGLPLAANSSRTFGVTNPANASVLIEQYTTVPNYGNAPATIPAHPRVQLGDANVSRYTNVFGYNLAWASSTDNYVTRTVSYFVPPATGFYRFYTRSDDGSVLYMNTNNVSGWDVAGKVQIAVLTASSSAYAANTGLSTNILLYAGQRYYLEMYQAEATGSDGFSLMWRPVTDASIPATNEVATGSVLELPMGPVTVTGITPANPVIVDADSQSLVLSVSGISGAPPYLFQWFRNGVLLPGANQTTLTLDAPSLADNGTVYTFVVSNQFSRAEISSTLTVQEDSLPPALVGARLLPVPDSLALVFSRPLNAALAQNPANFGCSGGLVVLSASLMPDLKTVYLLTSAQTPGATYSVTARNLTDNTASARLLAPNPASVEFSAPLSVAYGAVRRQWFNALATANSTAISALLGHAKFVGNRPDAVDYLTSANSPQTVPDASDYGVRLTGYILPTLTGNYGFQLSSDDSSMLWLSPDESPAGKVEVINRVGSGTQASTTSSYLVAGKVYFFEAVMKEGSGGDKLEVQWRPPFATAYSIIPGVNLAYALHAPQVLSLVQQPMDVTASQGQITTFTVRAASTETAIGYQWQVNGVDVAGATNSAFTTWPITAADQGMQVRCLVSAYVLNNPLAGVTYSTAFYSATATLTVSPAPALIGASSFGFTDVVAVAFGKPMDSGTALNPANYTLDPPVAVQSARFGPDESIVLLGTGPLTPGQAYVLTVSSVMDQEVPAHAVAPNPATARFTQWAENSGFFSDFESGVPSGLTLYGNSVVTNGWLRLTLNTSNTVGAAIFNDLLPGQPIAHFTASFRVYTGEGGPTEAADGFSFNFANDLPNGTAGNAEQGVGTGLSVGFKTYQTDTFIVKYKGVILTNVTTSIIYLPGIAPCVINLDRDGTLDITYNGLVVLTNFSTGYVPAPGRFGFFGRTGGSYANHWVDDVSLNVLGETDRGLTRFVTPPTSVTVVENQPFTFTAAVEGAFPLKLQWFDNGAPIFGGTGFAYTGQATLGMNQHRFSVLADSGAGFVRSSSATLTVLPDTNAPTVAGIVLARYQPTLLTLNLSEPVTPATATNLANFALSGGAAILRAVLLPGDAAVQLTTTPLEYGSNYVLTVNGLLDKAFVPNAMAADRQVVFTTYVLNRGFVTAEVFTNLPSGGVDMVTSSLKYINSQPDILDYRIAVGYRSVPPFPGVGLENYGARVSGYFIAPSNGAFRFYMRSDDSSQLWMNTNRVNSTDPAGRVLLANVASANISYTNPVTKTVDIPMTAGQMYYFEALLKEATSTDFITLTYRERGNSTTPADTEMVGTTNFATMIAPLNVTLNVTGPGPSLLLTENDIATLAVTVSLSPSNYPVFIQWQQGDGAGNFTDLAGQNGTRLTTSFLTTNVTYRVIVSTPGASRTLTTALQVQPDTTPPSVTHVTGSPGLNRVHVYFNERLEAQSATNLANYALFGPGGVPVLVAGLQLDPSLTHVVLTTEAQLSGTNYTVQVSGVRDVASAANLLVGAVQAEFTGWVLSKGFLYVEQYTNVVGSLVANLLASAKYPDLADSTFYVIGAAVPTTSPNLDNFGGRLSGFIVPPVSGDYILYVRGDDRAELRLGTGSDPATLRLIATNGTANASFTNGASLPVALVAGQAYAVEATYKEGAGSDMVQIGWQMPGDANITLVPAPYVAAFANPSGVQVSVVQSPTNTAVLEVRSAAFDLALAVQPTNLANTVYYQWRRFDALSGAYTNLPGANSRALVTPLLAIGEDAVYSVEYSVPGLAARVIEPVQLTVLLDVEPPKVVSVGSLNGSEICVVFDELIDVVNNTGTDFFLYSIRDAYMDGQAYEAVLRPDGRSVVIKLLTPVQGDFTVSIDGVLDRSSTSSNLLADPSGPSYPCYDVVSGRVENGAYQTVDVGNPGVEIFWPGAAFVPASNRIEVTANGKDIWDYNDGFRFIYREVEGDFDVRTRVSGLTVSDPWAKAGLMARASLAPNSRHIDILATPSTGINTNTFQWRDTDGAISGSNKAGYCLASNSWVRLQRIGDLFQGYWSTNGVDWLLVDRRDASVYGGAYSNLVLVGLATTSHNTNLTTTAVYEDFRFVDRPVFALQPQAVTVVENAELSLAGGATGEGVVAYQWLQNDLFLAGQTNATLLVANAPMAAEGAYALVARNSAGAVTSAVVTVQVLAPVTITNQPLSVQVQAGSDVTLTVGAVSSLPLTYQWTFQSTLLPEATGASLVITNVQAAQAGTYQVVVSNRDYSRTSSVAVVAIGVLADVTLVAPVRENGAFRFGVKTVAGRTYTLEYKDDLVLDWQSGASVAGNGEVLELLDAAASGSRRFYRLRVE